MGSGAKPQPPNDLVHIWAKKSRSGGNNFMDCRRNKFNFLEHLQLKIMSKQDIVSKHLLQMIIYMCNTLAPTTVTLTSFNQHNLQQFNFTLQLISTRNKGAVPLHSRKTRTSIADNICVK